MWDDYDAQMTHAGIFTCSEFLGPLWKWKHRWTPAAEVGKILFVEKRNAAWRHAVDPGNQWYPGSGWRLGFIPVFVYCPRVEMSLRCRKMFLGRRSVSLANYHLLGPPAVHPSINIITQNVLDSWQIVHISIVSFFFTPLPPFVNHFSSIRI
jgi:hypothetical protein